MKSIICRFGIFLAGSCCIVQAGIFEIGIDIGYGVSIGGTLTATDMTIKNGKSTDADYRYMSFGNGIKIDAEAVVYPIEGLGIVMNSGVSLLGGYDMRQISIDTLSGSNPREYTYSTRTFHFPLRVGVLLKKKIGEFEPYSCLSAGCFMPFRTSEYSYSDGSSGTSEVFYDPGFNLAGRVGLMFALTSNLGIRIETCGEFASACQNRVESTRNYNGTTSTINTTYVNKPQNELKPSTTSGTTTTNEYSGKPMVPFNSIGIRTGIVFSF